MKQVYYSSKDFLDCACDPENQVIICVPNISTVSDKPYIEGTVTDRKFCSSQCSQPYYNYNISYDESQLTDPTYSIKTVDIRGLVCRDCLTSYIDSSTGGTPSLRLEDLTDVDITSVSDDQVLSWDSSDSKWVNQTPSSGSVVTEVQNLSWANNDTVVVTHPADPTYKRACRAFVDGIANIASYPGFLLHGQGTNHSTTIIDELGHTCTGFNSAEIITADHYFGNSCLSTPITGNNGGTEPWGGYVRIYGDVPHGSLVIGTQDFTFDCRIKSNYYPYSETITLLRSGGLTSVPDLMILLNTAGNTTLTLYTGLYPYYGTTISTRSCPFMGNSVWTHFAVVRSAGVFYTFVDGVMDGGAAATVNIGQNEWGVASIFDNQAGLILGGNNCYFNELHLAIGVALFTSSFTPPTLPYSFTPASIIPVPLMVGSDGLFTDTSLITATYDSATQTTFKNKTGYAISATAIVET